MLVQRVGIRCLAVVWCVVQKLLAGDEAPPLWWRGCSHKRNRSSSSPIPSAVASAAAVYCGRHSETACYQPSNLGTVTGQSCDFEQCRSLSALPGPIHSPLPCNARALAGLPKSDLAPPLSLLCLRLLAVRFSRLVEFQAAAEFFFVLGGQFQGFCRPLPIGIKLRRRLVFEEMGSPFRIIG